MLSRSGWRAAHGSLGGLALLVGLPLSWRYIRERSSDEHKSAAVVHSGMTWHQGLRSFAFWIITAILFVSSISIHGTITHLSALLTDRGLTAENGALSASLRSSGRGRSSEAVALRHPVVLENVIGDEELRNQRHPYQSLVRVLFRTRACNIVTWRWRRPLKAIRSSRQAQAVATQRL
jgi:hypothetical protein